jgi:hypothetical protein
MQNKSVVVWILMCAVMPSSFNRLVEMAFTFTVESEWEDIERGYLLKQIS